MTEYQQKPIGWRVPAAEMDAFESWVAQKHPQKSGYVRFEIENAMEKFANTEDVFEQYTGSFDRDTLNRVFSFARAQSVNNQSTFVATGDTML